MLRSGKIIACCILALLAVSPALADAARQDFDSLYGQKIRHVTATADHADDIALAREKKRGHSWDILI